MAEDVRLAMIRSMFQTLKTEGCRTVQADLPEGEAKPGLLNGVAPDLIGWTESGKAIVVAVETCESLRSFSIEERLAALYPIQAEGHEVRLLVPSECAEVGEALLKRLRLPEDVLWEHF